MAEAQEALVAAAKAAERLDAAVDAALASAVTYSWCRSVMKGKKR